MPLLLDTGPLYALADADDAWHAPVRDFLAEQREILLVPVTVLPEVAYLLRSRLGGEVERRFVASVAAAELSVEDLRPADVERSAELMATYPDIGFVDATVAAMAERLKLPAIVTTDRRHFAPIHPRHRPFFDLLPLTSP
jgi:hypothetical protein